MIYDVIIGETLPTKYSYNYLKGTFFNRIEMEDVQSNDFGKLVEIIADMLKQYTNTVAEPVDEILSVISELNILKTRLDSGEENADSVDEKVRELLSTLAYFGVDLYIIRRPDLTSVDFEEGKTRAYMIDKHDGYFPSVNRIVNGKSIIFDNVIDASISTVVMKFLEAMDFTDVAEESVVKNFRNQFEGLEMAHMGWSLNTDPLIEFLDDYGYKFIVAITA